MQRKRKNSESQISSGFSDLMGSYITALEENSEDIALMLEMLKDKKLSVQDKKFLKSFKRQLKEIDSSLEDIG